MIGDDFYVLSHFSVAYRMFNTVAAEISGFLRIRDQPDDQDGIEY